MNRIVITLIAFLVLLGCRPPSPTVGSYFYSSAPESIYKGDIPDGRLTVIRIYEGPPTEIKLEGFFANNGYFGNLYMAMRAHPHWNALRLDRTEPEVSLIYGVMISRPYAQWAYEVYRLNIEIVEERFQTKIVPYGTDPESLDRAIEVAGALDGCLNDLGGDDWIPGSVTYMEHWPAPGDDGAIVVVWERP